MSLYSGVAAGSFLTERGGGSNYLCLPDVPEFLNTTSGIQELRTRLYGAEYETVDSPTPDLDSLKDHNVPCSACHTSARGDVIMIPGRVTCPDSWTREYYGYLMAEYHNHHRNSFECVDVVNAETVPDSAVSHNGALFYFTELASCNGINCPPYSEGSELACVVCTK